MWMGIGDGCDKSNHLSTYGVQKYENVANVFYGSTINL